MRTDSPPPQRLYPRLLGPAWANVAPAIQRVHTVPGAVRAQAHFEVCRPPSQLLGRLLDLAGVPAAAHDTPVLLAIAERLGPNGPSSLNRPQERWHRVFGGRPLVTLQHEAPGRLLAERAGPLEFRFRLHVEDGALLYQQQACWLRLGALQWRLPHWLAPTVWCRESATGCPARAPVRTHVQTHVQVRVAAPRGGLLFSYRGTVTWNVTQVMPCPPGNVVD